MNAALCWGASKRLIQAEKSRNLPRKFRIPRSNPPDAGHEGQGQRIGGPLSTDRPFI